MQLLWVLDHLDDIASDLSVFHRIDCPYELKGPAYFKLAMRLYCYAGVMQQRVIAEQMDDTGTSPAAPVAAGARAASRDINPGAKATLMADPAFAGVFSFA